MAIFTGNNGRIYIARKSTSGLQGSFSVAIVNGVAVTTGESFWLANVESGGSGAIVTAGQTISATATSRDCTFIVVTPGQGYLSGDTLYVARTISNSTQKVSNNFTVSTASTIGVDSEGEILQERYRIAKIRSWSLNSQSEVVETTALGDAVKTYAASVTSGSGNATLMYYKDQVQTGPTSQLDSFQLMDLLFPRGVAPRVILSLGVDGSAGNNFLFDAFITSASLAASYGEVVAIEVGFTVDGRLLDIPSYSGVARI